MLYFVGSIGYFPEIRSNIKSNQVWLLPPALVALSHPYCLQIALQGFLWGSVLLALSAIGSLYILGCPEKGNFSFDVLSKHSTVLLVGVHLDTVTPPSSQ